LGTRNKERRALRIRKGGHQEQGNEGTKNKERRALRARKEVTKNKERRTLQ
jgi:hypothetical protein